MTELEYTDYQVGWICALESEHKAATLMLDKQHPPLPPAPGDNNTYTFGRMGNHNVVITCLPTGMTGTNSAARVATQMRRTFPSAFGLMVGIAGGIPSEKHDIRLGDVVVSEPSGRFGGVVEYDFGKTVQNGRFQMGLRPLNKPSDLLLGVLPKIKGEYHGGGPQMRRYYEEMLARYPEQAEFARRPESDDVLYSASYDHPSEESSCSGCDRRQIIRRQPRTPDAFVPVVHYGLIASGNQVMRHGITRDRLREVGDVLCYEMEAAGLMDTAPFLIVRGICDYADSHKEKSWQNYAAVMAAAYAKVFLTVLLPRSPAHLTLVSSRDVREASLWVSPNPQRSFHKNLVDIREEKTGEWFVKEPLFEKWMQSNNKGILWLTGIPGAGKSILASSIIDYLNAYCKESEATGMGYFYCSYRDDRTQEIQQIAASLVSQLSGQSQDIARFLVDHYKARRHAPDMYQKQPIDTDVLFEMMREGFKHLEKIFIVIDALDECRDRTLVARKLLNLYRDTEYPIKILVTSREEPDLMTLLEAFPTISLSNHIQRDIEIYLAAQMERKVKQQPGWCSDSMQEKIITKISKMAGNMFQLAAYQWHIISEECYNYDEIQEKLGSLPETIDGVYRRILETSESRTGNFELRHNILRWLAGAKRALRLEELAEAVFIKDAQERWNESTVGNQPERLARLCGSLVYFNKDTNEVSLCHFSLKEFLTSDRILKQGGEAGEELSSKKSKRKPVDIKRYHLDLQETHQRLAKHCLTYLLFEDFKAPYKDRAHLDQVRQRYKLLDYATLYAGEHLKELDSCSDEITVLLDKLFLPELSTESIQEPELKKKVKASVSLSTFTTYCPPVQQDKDHEYCGTYASPNLSLRGWKPREQKKESSNWNIWSFLSRLWESLSCWYTHISLMGFITRRAVKQDSTNDDKTLVEHYSKWSLQQTNRRTWLQLYRIIGPQTRKDHHENITPLYFAGLFNWRAGVSEYIHRGSGRISTSDLNHSLRGVAIGGSLREEEKGKCASLIQMLLDAGAEVESNPPNLGSALQSAAYCGNLEAVDALLDAGAPANEKQSFYRPGGSIGSAVQAAAMSGNQAIVKSLIDQGAAINQATGWLGTPLTAVLECELTSMASFLLRHNARPDIIAGYYVSSLHFAAKGIASFDEILDKAEDVNVNLHPYGTPLHIACDSGVPWVVEKLLHRSANIHTPGGQFGTAIQAASWTGSRSIMKTLLSHGADPNSEGIPLLTHANTQIAAPYYGRALILQGGRGLHDHWPEDKYLHDHWDNLFPRVGFYALSLAAAKRANELVHNKALVLFEFEPTHQGGHYGNPLQTASFQGHVEAVQVLLEGNANVNATCGVFGTALQAAAYAGHEQVVRMLLNHGADPSIQAGFFGLPLLAAAASTNERVNDMLIGAGADPNARDEHGWTQASWHRLYGASAPAPLRGNRRFPSIPSRWGTGWYKSPQLALGDDGRELHFLGSPFSYSTPLELAASAMTNHPLPPGTDWYFEFKIGSSGSTGKLSIGVSDGLMPRFQLPGQYARSWGYEGSTGQCWGAKESLHRYKAFGTGDIVGCGFRFNDGVLYFVRNGERQLPEIEIPALRLFPTVGMCSQGAWGVLLDVLLEDGRIGGEKEEDEDICLV